MKLSAPVFRLKRQAKLLARHEGIPLHQAQDRIAQQEGFQRWSHLAAHHAEDSISKLVLDQLDPGNLVLLAGQRNHGKTALAFHLLEEALKAGRSAYYFSLVENGSDVEQRITEVGVDLAAANTLFSYDTSDEISASYVIDRCSNAVPGSFIVIDYLQILDQQRDKPVLAEQVDALHSFAQETETIVALISQIDRTFELSDDVVPNLDHIRLPNPVDLTKFTKSFFVHDGEVTVHTSA